MKTGLLIALACACMHVEAHCSHGGIGAGSNGHSALQMGHTNVAMHASNNAMQSAANTSNSNGGRVYPEDNYQPWPQAEMQQFAKKDWKPYDGK